MLGGGFLWLFGPSVEDAMGRLRFVLFAALGGGAAAALDPAAAGAGVVAAVLGGYALLYPRAHVVALSLVPGFMTVVPGARAGGAGAVAAPPGAGRRARTRLPSPGWAWGC